MLIRKVGVLGMTLGHALVLGSLVALPVVSAQAGSHTWDVNEVFSDSTGNVQFIELVEANGTPNETAVPGHTMTSTANNFVIVGAALVAPTSNKFYLIGTAAFAALPGAPTPDATMPVSFFSTLAAETVTYVPWDAMAWGAGVLPTDGTTSLNSNLTTGVNSPTNYAGASGSVGGGSSEIPVLSEWGLILFALLLLAAVAHFGLGQRATS